MLQPRKSMNWNGKWSRFKDSQRGGDRVIKTSCEWWLEVVKPWGPRLFKFTQSPQDSGCKLNDPRLSWNSVFEGYCERALMNAAVARFAQRVQIFLPNVFQAAVARFAQRVQIFLPNVCHICFRCRQCSPPYLHPCSESSSQLVGTALFFCCCRRVFTTRVLLHLALRTWVSEPRWRVSDGRTHART
jgi:hypothetical protein